MLNQGLSYANNVPQTQQFYVNGAPNPGLNNSGPQRPVWKWPPENDATTNNSTIHLPPIPVAEPPPSASFTSSDNISADRNIYSDRNAYNVVGPTAQQNSSPGLSPGAGSQPKSGNGHSFWSETLNLLPLVVSWVPFIIVIATQDCALKGGLIGALVVSAVHILVSFVLWIMQILKAWPYILDIGSVIVSATLFGLTYDNEYLVGKWLIVGFSGFLTFCIAASLFFGIPFMGPYFKQIAPAQAWDGGMFLTCSYHVSTVWGVGLTAITALALIPPLVGQFSGTEAPNIIFNYVVPACSLIACYLFTSAYPPILASQFTVQFKFNNLRVQNYIEYLSAVYKHYVQLVATLPKAHTYKPPKSPRPGNRNVGPDARWYGQAEGANQRPKPYSNPLYYSPGQGPYPIRDGRPPYSSAPGSSPMYPQDMRGPVTQSMEGDQGAGLWAQNGHGGIYSSGGHGDPRDRFLYTMDRAAVQAGAAPGYEADHVTSVVAAPYSSFRPQFKSQGNVPQSGPLSSYQPDFQRYGPTPQVQLPSFRPGPAQGPRYSGLAPQGGPGPSQIQPQQLEGGGLPGGYPPGRGPEIGFSGGGNPRDQMQPISNQPPGSTQQQSWASYGGPQGPGGDMGYRDPLSAQALEGPISLEREQRQWGLNRDRY